MDIQEVIMYQTGDGSIHPSRADAEKHIINIVHEFLDVKIRPLLKEGRLTSCEKYHVITRIADSAADVDELIGLFSRL